MPSISRSILFAAVVSILAALSEAPAARDFADGWEGGYWADMAVSDPIPSKDTWRAYYATDARLRSGPEKQSANGVRWRLATDRRTGIAMPSNHLDARQQEAGHRQPAAGDSAGGAMLFARKEQASLRAYAKDYAENGPGWPVSKEDYERRRKTLQDMMKEPLVEQTDVALTYASARFVSLIDLGFINKIEGTYLPRIIRGVNFVTSSGDRFSRWKPAPKAASNVRAPSTTQLFRFADLLDICDQASLEQFEALVEAVDDRIRAATADSRGSFRLKAAAGPRSCASRRSSCT